MSLPYVEKLEAIRIASGGLLRPDGVVARAADPRSALHGYFTWDDTEAAQRYRLVQARELIRCVVTIVERPQSAPLQVRAYVSLPSDRATNGGYRTVVDVLDDRALAAEALESLRTELARLRMKFQAYSQLALILGGAEEAVQQLQAPPKRRGRGRAAVTAEV